MSLYDVKTIIPNLNRTFGNWRSVGIDLQLIRKFILSSVIDFEPQDAEFECTHFQIIARCPCPA